VKILSKTFLVFFYTRKGSAQDFSCYPFDDALTKNFRIINRIIYLHKQRQNSFVIEQLMRLVLLHKQRPLGVVFLPYWLIK